MTRKKTDIEHVPQTPGELATEITRLDERRKRQVQFAAAPSTQEAYGRDMAQFEVWCRQRGAKHLPCDPDVLGLWLARLEEIGLRPSTIGRKLAAVVRHHKAEGHDSPRNAYISEQMKGIMRGEPGKRPNPAKEAPPLTSHELALLVRAMESASPAHRLLVARDRAALLVGWACAMRRSEIVGLDLQDAELVREGWQIHIRRSKTDKTGQGSTLALAPAERNKDLCPVRALETWLAARGDKPGPLFWKSLEQEDHRTVPARLLPGEPMPWHQFNRLIRRWTRLAKLMAPNGRTFSPHSLRAGFITEAINIGRPIATTKERSRHKSMDVFFRYVRIAMTFENNVQKGML